MNEPAPASSASPPPEGWGARAGAAVRGAFRRARAGASSGLQRLEDPVLRRRIGRGFAASVLGVGLYSGIVRVHEGEVGVLVNNVTGSLTVVEQVGYRLTLPGVQTFHRLDRRVQALLMSNAGGAGFTPGDAVLIKTADGSNVSLDVQVSYRLLPELADQVLRSAGPGNSFGDLWIRSAVRAAVSAEFGKLTTEQVYDTAHRNERAAAVVYGLNQALGGHGVEVVAVVAQDFHFYKEYEEIIRNKKLADQEVEEQQAQARLASEQQRKELNGARYNAQRTIAQATGEAAKIRATADGYVSRVLLESEGELITAKARAEGLLAVGLAEAEGIKESALAMSGGGGVNLVALEYAKKLQNIQFTGVPVLQDGRQGQLRITNATGAPTTDGVAQGDGRNR